MSEQSIRRLVCDDCGLTTGAHWGYPALYDWAIQHGWVIGHRRQSKIFLGLDETNRPVSNIECVDLCPACAKKAPGTPEGKASCPASKSPGC
jgi:hypothetical protein